MTGLPPTPEQIDSFLGDSSPDAYEKLLDDLLASPRYGERWARHWLDVVRYADSGGYETDEYFPNAWRYRDYVIKSFNDNKPYDRFVQEQIAGDELWPDNLDLHDEYYGISPEKLEHLEARIGTGLYTFGPEIVESLLHAPRLVHERLTDWVDTTGAAFMGLTVACARCHTHKFDPISQRDYYRLQAFFAASRPMQIPVVTKMGMFHRNESYPLMIAVDEARTAYRLYEAKVKERITGEAKSEFPPEVVEAYELPEEERTPEQKELVMPLVEVLKSLEENWEERRTPEEREELDKRFEAMGKALLKLPDQDFSHTVDYDGLYDLPRASVLGHRQLELIPEVHVLDRGNLGSRTERVAAAVPAVFDYLGSPMDGERPVGTRAFQTRRQLALWLSRPDHPLTARVMVNRLWQWHFGQGIVLTPNDYGAQGEPPTHPRLLDWLATEFVAQGWNIKAMHRLIMASSAYRMSSRYSNIAGADHRQFVGKPANVLKKIRDLDSGFAVSLERSGRTHQLRFMSLDKLQVQVLGPEAGRQILPVQAIQFRLGIEGIQVRRPTLHEHEDDVFCPGREVGCPGSQRVVDRSALQCSTEGGFLTEQATQGQSSRLSHSRSLHQSALQRVGSTGAPDTGFLGHLRAGKRECEFSRLYRDGRRDHDGQR